MVGGIQLFRVIRPKGNNICFVCDKPIARRMSEAKKTKNFKSYAMGIKVVLPKDPKDITYMKRQFGRHYPRNGRIFEAAVCWECWIDLLGNSNKWGSFI